MNRDGDTLNSKSVTTQRYSINIGSGIQFYTKSHYPYSYPIQRANYSRENLCNEKEILKQTSTNPSSKRDIIVYQNLIVKERPKSSSRQLKAVDDLVILVFFS